MLSNHDRENTTKTIIMYLVECFAERGVIDELQLMSPYTFYSFDVDEVADLELLDDRDGFMDVNFILFDGRRFNREGSQIE